MSCWKHRFTNHRDAEFWGPSYQCQKCGWWHIQYRDRRIAWERIAWVVWGAILCYVVWDIVWDLVWAAIEWNWP